MKAIKILISCICFMILGGGFFSAAPVEAGVVQVAENFEVNINDSSVYYRGKGHANVVISKFRGHGWESPYPVEVFWGKGYCVYRLDWNGNRVGMESDLFALPIANYMSERYE